MPPFKISFLLTIMISCFSQGANALDVKQADKVIIEKAKRTLTLLSQGKVIKFYQVALGFEPIGHKQFEGDGKTPEGLYKIDWRKDSRKFHKSLHVSYPSAVDTKRAKALGKSPGGAIMIHGLGVFNFFGKLHLKKDWTLGCAAVTNEEIDEIWRLVPDGTDIEILP